MRSNLGDRACVPQSGLHMRLKYALAFVAFACLKTVSPQQQPTQLPDFRIRISGQHDQPDERTRTIRER